MPGPIFVAGLFWEKKIMMLMFLCQKLYLSRYAHIPNILIDIFNSRKYGGCFYKMSHLIQMQLAYFDVNSVSFLLVVSWPVTMAPSLHTGKQAAVRPSPSRVGQSATATEALSQGHCPTFLRNCKRYRTISSFCIWYIQQKFIVRKIVILTFIILYQNEKVLLCNISVL